MGAREILSTLSLSHSRTTRTTRELQRTETAPLPRRQMQSCSPFWRARDLNTIYCGEFLSIFSFTKNKFKVFSAKNARVLSLSLSHLLDTLCANTSATSLLRHVFVVRLTRALSQKRSDVALALLLLRRSLPSRRGSSRRRRRKKGAEFS